MRTRFDRSVGRFLIAVWLSEAALHAAGFGGSINTNTTWPAKGGPYLISTNLTIQRDATLTIEPGTELFLDAGVSFAIADGGRLLAEGSESAPIRFTHPTGSSSRWGGISINGSAGSPESRLRFIHIEFNGSTAIRSTAGTLLLDHLSFGTTDRQYISVDGSSFLISNCSFPSGTVEFELLHGTAGIKAGGYGIVRDCFFGSTLGYNDVMDFTGGNRPNQPIIQFFNNVFTGSSDDILDLDGTDAWIEGNIFLHSHKNGAPDTSAAVSGGNSGTNTSEITMIGNLFFDCDQAATAKQGNFFALLNNTIAHITNAGGLDTDSGVLCVRDLVPAPPTTFGRGFYLEGNIIVDASQLVRNYVEGQTTVTFVNNILPVSWTGAGNSNTIVDPLLKHLPRMEETRFADWAEAQVLREWLSLSPNSPGRGNGPNGRDKGGVIPLGAFIAGEPLGLATNTSATLTVGLNRSGSAIPTLGWPDGLGYTHYKWRLDQGSWSAETPINARISLFELTDGAHYVEVIGKRDSGWYQDDPLLGPDAVVTRSQTWTVRSGIPRISAVNRVPGGFAFRFNEDAGKTYSVQYRNSLAATNWFKLLDVPAQPTAGDYLVADPNPAGPARFYRIVTPAQP